MSEPDRPGDGSGEAPPTAPPMGMAITSTVCGVISIFFMAPIFSTLGLVFGGIGLSQKEHVLSTIGIVASILGILTSPIIMGLIGMGSMLAMFR